ncbi:MAG: hypothetical protein O3B31_02170 [Chloroflexi bacterium]|nr:hypothetical protein [Chloroflexota bacterium]MDA1002148.1 hypothetical protein [Chloroflexota bacterium]
MSYGPCYTLTQRTTEEFNSDHGREWIRRLLHDGASREELIEAFATQSAPELADLVRLEFSEMPDPMFQTIMASWLAADGSGRAFELRSERPEKPLEFAHRRRVRLTVDYEEDRAIVSVSHVAGHHAQWYKPTVAVSQ